MSLFKSQSANPLQQFQTQPRQIEKSQSDQPIVGLRVWNLAMTGGLPKLVSVTMTMEWPYRKPMERDGIKAMGIHAIKLGTGIVELFNQYSAALAGEVYLWGKIDEHEFGYLADFAYPKKLFLPNGFDSVKAMLLEEEYGVPVEFRAEFDKPEASQGYAIYPGMQLGISTGSGGLSTLYPQAMQQMSQQAYMQMQQAQAIAQSNAQAIQNTIMYGTGLFKNPWSIP